MAYTVELKRSAEKELDRLPERMHNRIVESLLAMEQNPRPRDVEDKLWVRHHSMPRKSQKRARIPEEFVSIKETAELWDTHDLTDYEDIWQEVDFHVDLKRPPTPRAELDPEIATECADGD
jgi:mRNA-degrading endonuclease RelE of RelBE toxin-antitoxin system